MKHWAIPAGVLLLLWLWSKKSSAATVPQTGGVVPANLPGVAAIPQVALQTPGNTVAVLNQPAAISATGTPVAIESQPTPAPAPAPTTTTISSAPAPTSSTTQSNTTATTTTVVGPNIGGGTKLQ